MATTTPAVRIRRAAAAVTAGVVLLAGAGCSFTNAQDTAEMTTTINGINTQVGPVELLDLLILSYGADQPGRVMGTVVNSSSKEAIVTISGASGSQVTIRVKANGQAQLDHPPAVTLNPTGSPPGSMLKVRVSEDATGTSADVQVPVLDDTLPEYRPYMPASPATGTTSGNAAATTPGSTASPGPSGTTPSSSSPSR